MQIPGKEQTPLVWHRRGWSSIKTIFITKAYYSRFNTHGSTGPYNFFWFNYAFLLNPKNNKFFRGKKKKLRIYIGLFVTFICLMNAKGQKIWKKSNNCPFSLSSYASSFIITSNKKYLWLLRSGVVQLKSQQLNNNRHMELLSWNNHVRLSVLLCIMCTCLFYDY